MIVYFYGNSFLLDQKPVMIGGSDDHPHQASSSPNYETEKYFLKPKMNKSFFLWYTIWILKQVAACSTV